ncbi:MAG: transposase [Planctomycetota bacterium]
MRPSKASRCTPAFAFLQELATVWSGSAATPLALERLSLTEDGRVLYKLKRRWSDGSTHLVFDPLTFLERLAALVPRPRANLVTYHGVLAPAASQRHRIVPETLPRPARTCPTTRIRHPRPIRQPSNGATPGPSSSNGCSKSTF